MLWQSISNACYDAGENRGICQCSSNCSKKFAHQNVMPFWGIMFQGACSFLLQIFQNTPYCSFLFLCLSGVHQFLEQVCISFTFSFQKDDTVMKSHSSIVIYSCYVNEMWKAKSKWNLNLHLVVTITKLILKQLLPQESHSARFMSYVHTCCWWTCHRCSVALICFSWKKTKEKKIFKKHPEYLL